MIDLQTAVGSLVTLLLSGGPDAAKDLVKGIAVKGADGLSKLWREIFAEKPETYPLADKVAATPQDAEAQQALRAVVEEMLKQRPEWLQQIQQNVATGDITAESGGVAAGVVSDSTITIKNR